MTRNEIVEKIYKQSIPKKAWKKLRDSAYEDYCQEMYLLLLEMPEEKMYKLYEQGKLEDYFFRICQHQASSYSKFSKMLYGQIETVLLSELIHYEDYDEGD